MKRIIKFMYFITFCILLAIVPSSNITANSQVTVFFDAAGGEITTTSKNVSYGSTYGTLPRATRDNYTFLGWYSLASGGVKVTKESSVLKAESHVLYAHWVGEPCKIKLDAEQGKLNNNSIIVYYGSRYGNQLPIPVRTNYTFDGWFTKAKGGEKIEAVTIVNSKSSRKLYAHWSRKKLKVTFIGFNDESYELTVTCGTKFGKLPVPKNDGYMFGGWYSWKDYSNYDALPITEETIVSETSPLTLFARWY